MSIALYVQTDLIRWALAITIPAYRPSSLLWVIIALAIAVLGLAADIAAGAIVGTVALPATVAAVGVVFFLLFCELERMRRPLWKS